MSAPQPTCAEGSDDHAWEAVTVESGPILVAAAVCTRCGARRFRVLREDRAVVRYARPPRWGTPADLRPRPPLLTGAAVPVPETTFEREQREWRERRAAMTARGTR
jgi:hypothetical protein